MKGKGLTILVIVIFFAGLSLLLYPMVSNYWNSIHQSQVIVDYDKELDQLTQEAYARLRAEAEEWNHTVAYRAYALNEEQKSVYYDQLDFSGRNIMGYLDIPSIGASLPIGHGTGDDVLQRSVGHLEWSSLPVGGEGTHCVLSGHRGLPSSELLTNIDHLEVGDLFSLHVLNEKLVYQVDRISVVEPEDLSLLGLEEGKDYVTLVTCTPYGINSHRLLVRGVRYDSEAEDSAATITVPGEGSMINSLYPAFIVLLALLVILFLALVLSGKRKKKRKGGARLQKENPIVPDTPDEPVALDDSDISNMSDDFDTLTDDQS